MCVAQHIPEWLEQRCPWYIQTFNIANYVLAAGSAALVAGGALRLEATVSSYAVAGIAAVATFIAVNRILLAAMLRLGRQIGLRASGLFALDDLALEFVLAAIAIPFTALWNVDASLSVLALAPLALIHFTQRATHNLELASMTIQDQNSRLLEANQPRSTPATRTPRATRVAFASSRTRSAGRSTSRRRASRA